MSNSIGPLGPPITSDYTPETATESNAGATAPAIASAADSNEVTLSSKVAGAASLVAAAQSSDGIDHNAVSQIRSALANGNYSVEPEDLAKAIATVLRGTR